MLNASAPRSDTGTPYGSTTLTSREICGSLGDDLDDLYAGNPPSSWAEPRRHARQQDQEQ